MTVVVRSVVTGLDSSRDLMCQHTRSTMPQINMIPYTVILN